MASLRARWRRTRSGSTKRRAGAFVDACARVPASGVRRARGSARRARRRVRESLDKEKPTLSAKTEPRRQGPRKSLTPCVGGVWKCFQSRARVAFSGTSRDCLPVRSRGWKTKANPTPKKTPNFPGEIPRLPRERAIGADSTRDGRLTPESTSESVRGGLKTTARRLKAPVENAVNIRDSRLDAIERARLL